MLNKLGFETESDLKLGRLLNSFNIEKAIGTDDYFKFKDAIMEWAIDSYIN